MYTGFVRLLKYQTGKGGLEYIYEGELYKGEPNGFGRYIYPGYSEMFVGQMDGWSEAGRGFGVYLKNNVIINQGIY